MKTPANLLAIIFFYLLSIFVSSSCLAWSGKVVSVTDGDTINVLHDGQQKKKMTDQDVLEELFDLIVESGLPDHIRSDNVPEFTAKAVREWLSKIGVQTLFIEPGSPWENGYVESFNGKFLDELLNGQIFTTLLEARVLIENWRREYNHIRPHSSLGCSPPAPQAIHSMEFKRPFLPAQFTEGLTQKLVQ